MWQELKFSKRNSFSSPILFKPKLGNYKTLINKRKKEKMALLKQTERGNLDVGRVRGDGGWWHDGDW